MNPPLSALPTPTPAPGLEHTGATRAKALRIGVIHDELLVAEHHALPDSGDEITLGHDPTATVHTPWETGIHHVRLFTRKSGKWHLRVRPDVLGVLVRGGKSHDVVALRAQARAKGVGAKDDLLIPLETTTSGRLKVGDARILFQFSTPPRTAPRPSLPLRMARSLGRLDWVWTNFLLAMAFFQGLGMVVLQLNYEPPADDTGYLSIPNVKVELPDQPPSNAAEEKTDDEKKGEPEKKPEPEKAAAKPKVEKPLDAQARKAQVQQKLNKQTIIRYLAAVTEGDNNNIVSSDQVGARLAAAWDGTPGYVGDEGETRSGPRYVDKGGAIGRAAGLNADDLGGESGAVDSGSTQEVKVKGRIMASAADEVFGDGSLDKAAISQVVQRRLGAIKSCYERELKTNPTLGGKVVVQFTIQESGRVGDVKILSDTTGGDGVGKCIANQIGHFRFPAPSGGSVTASYPFVLQPGS